MSNPNAEETRRPAAVLRKEVVPTDTWGEVVVRALRLSERLAVGDVPEVDGETVDARSRRIGRVFSSRLLAAAVTDKAGAALYAADEWDIWLGTHAGELAPVIDKALMLGGFDGLRIKMAADGAPPDGSDPAKNG